MFEKFLHAPTLKGDRITLSTSVVLEDLGSTFGNSSKSSTKNDLTSTGLVGIFNSSITG